MKPHPTLPQHLFEKLTSQELSSIKVDLSKLDQPDWYSGISIESCPPANAKQIEVARFYLHEINKSQKSRFLFISTLQKYPQAKITCLNTSIPLLILKIPISKKDLDSIREKWQEENNTYKEVLALARLAKKLDSINLKEKELMKQRKLAEEKLSKLRLMKRKLGDDGR